VTERRLPNFIEAFCKFATIYNTTPLFARYAAIWLLGTSVFRSVGMKAWGNEQHPNFYFQLVGGPGTGKSQAIKAVRRIMLPAIKEISLIPASITRAGMEDYMAKNMKSRRMPGGQMLFQNECIGLSEEMQGILPDQDLGHLTLYNILYDLPPLHIAQTRSNGELRLESPYCSLLTGCQPAFLATTMPEQAWGMGFMSRSTMVFDVPRERRSMFSTTQPDTKLEADLIHDLRLIHKLNGWMEWTKPAVTLYEEWYVKHGGQPIPQAKRLAMGYNARREIHMTKLAMVMSLSRGDSLFVELEDVAAAIKLLLLTEERMKMVFTEMSATGSAVAIEDALDMVRAKSVEGEGLDEAVLIDILMQRFPATQVNAVIENLIASRAIILKTGKGSINARGFRKFVAGERTAIGG
jgi:hypothetical protein